MWGFLSGKVGNTESKTLKLSFYVSADNENKGTRRLHALLGNGKPIPQSSKTRDTTVHKDIELPCFVFLFQQHTKTCFMSYLTGIFNIINYD